MTLDQLHELKRWHQRHWREHPLERHAWDAVLTLWLVGCVGAPTALVIHRGWAELAMFALLLLPNAYVAARRRLHDSGVLRCDWLGALR